ncbi:hypothetical protein BKG94_07290 [Rodentibacter ratti]|uniref:hypothetical protein n=1 Tax=Rodentibacter ratti TaxID=1906745 RepID=UPI000985DE6C|nr:hypothetical protein [Rodentibacter ratti]OOF88328.1 hypothetical protein BKG94_07290 [Rodentibacter ratti]
MKKSKTVKPFKTPYTPTPEQLEKSVKRIKQFLAFAEDYLHNGHYNGLVNSIEQIKKAATIRKPRTVVGGGR